MVLHLKSLDFAFESIKPCCRRNALNMFRKSSVDLVKSLSDFMKSRNDIRSLSFAIGVAAFHMATSNSPLNLQQRYVIPITNKTHKYFTFSSESRDVNSHVYLPRNLEM